MTSEYSTFKPNMPIQNYLADPVQDCIPGNFFNGADNPLRYDIGRCDAFMSQRCARNWDGYCDIYLRQQKKADHTGKASNKFLTDALNAQFCRVDTSLPGSENTCYTRCEQMDPLAPDSAQICRNDGDYIYRKSLKSQNIDTQFNSTGRLTTPSGISIAKCPMVCDKFTEENLSDNNRILNECLDRGIAADALINIAENAISANIKITNSRFLKFINSFVLTKSDSLKPGFSSLGASPMLTTVQRALPAVDPFIQKGSKYLVNNDALFGPQLNDIKVKKNKVKKNKVEENKVEEKFEYDTNKDSLPKFTAINPESDSENIDQTLNLNKNIKIQPSPEFYRYADIEKNESGKKTKTILYIIFIIILLFLLTYVIIYK
jgi:hypothetical protein